MDKKARRKAGKSEEGELWNTLASCRPDRLVSKQLFRS